MPALPSRFSFSASFSIRYISKLFFVVEFHSVFISILEDGDIFHLFMLIYAGYGALSCAKCAIGTYSNTIAAATCYSCNPGYFTPSMFSYYLFESIFLLLFYFQLKF